MAIYDLSNDFDKRSFSEKVKFFLENKCRVELVRKTHRTRAQNSYLHLILGYFAIETGNDMNFVKEEYFKKLCNHDLFLTKKNDDYLGEVLICKSTRDLTTEEMSIAITRFRDWSSKIAGIYIPSANEGDFLIQIEQLMNRNQKYIY